MSVASLERSIAFYRDVLGLKVIRERAFEGGPHERIMGLEGAKGRLAILQAETMRLELFEFTNPSPKLSHPERPVSDHGISHFCIEVMDIDEEYRRLKSAGVPFTCPPIEFSGMAMATYGRDPDGNMFELIELHASACP